MNPRPGASDQDIDRLEGEIGRKVPNSLREWLRQHNGGRMRDAELDLPDGSATGQFDLLGVQRAEDYADIRIAFADLRQRIPDATIPFLVDGVGNYILAAASGEVLFWNHDTEETLEIAASFRDFLSQIRFIESIEKEPAPAPPELAARGAAFRGDTDALRAALDQGVDPNATEPDGTTLLMRAAFSGSLESVTLLIERGADPTLVNRRGQTAHQFALLGRHRPLAERLKEFMGSGN